jgi:hypothetical protein
MSDAADLFSAAVRLARRTYGESEHVEQVRIVTRSGAKLAVDVPRGWEPAAPSASPLTSSPGCLAEVLATIVDAGKRLTRAALLAEMEKRDRTRAESTVSEALADLIRLGILDNRQDVNPKGYGLPDW